MALPSSSRMWRNRDALDDLKRPSSLSLMSSSSMQLSNANHFDVETCLSRLRRDKATIARASFSAAAHTVVQAVQDNNRQQQQQQQENANYNPADLPSRLTDWQRLQQLRVHSMERAQKLGSSATSGGSSSSASRTTDSKGGVLAEAISSSGFSSSGKATTAASSAVLDSRATVSRAVLCSAASLALEELTPAYANEKLDPLDIPQNKARQNETLAAAAAKETGTASAVVSSSSVNMGAVLLQAQTLGQRAIDQGKNAARRSTQRQLFRKAMAQPQPMMCEITNPFAWTRKKQTKKPEAEDSLLNSSLPLIPPVPYNPNASSLTDAWHAVCWPRMRAILRKGTGHTVLCDADWHDRHGRIAHILTQMGQGTGSDGNEDTGVSNSGPHLIVATQPEVDRFAQEFQPAETKVRLVTPPQSPGSSAKASPLRVLSYVGSRAQRCRLRRDHFVQYHYGKYASYHVLVVSYSDFLEDYLHFCQVPFQAVVLDEGFLWLAAAQADPNSQLGSIWSNAVFSSNDQHIGLAGSLLTKDWDFGEMNPSAKHAYIGLTARHRILTTKSLSAMSSHATSSSSYSHKQQNKSSTLPGLMSVLLPHFSDVVREEWDRSRITHDQPSIDHLKKLLARSIVVHTTATPSSTENLAQLALDSMEGRLPHVNTDERSLQREAPTFVSDEDFVAEGKISQSRRSALTWLSPWLRYDLGMAHFSTILAAMKESTTHGHVCEEIVPASSTTSSGAGGTVSGSLAYRLAVRCGRTFGSEQGLRQHMAALHAPPGTWLCRTCGSDCGTSQARTHHERTCGQPIDSANPPNSSGGRGGGGGGKGNQHGPVGVVGKKNKGGKSASAAQDKDADGSFRVPGYRGVWVNPAGKHFIKINKKRWEKEDGSLSIFETVEQAARQHDEVLKKGGLPKNAELNYKPDGTRIVYEDSTAASAAGRGLEMLGGGTSSVVPALSVINIKDLPKDVKPLLRDPRQTSRTGGNSKRHVYAYRGVCRQARKGHDRWQSQISFGGTNHYLGTFDSEWDAAAVYAWAHLILYGEEATKKAQREGEEAAAAYEREKAAIAAGEVLPPPPKPEKKKKATKRKKADADGDDDGKKKKRTSSPATGGKGKGDGLATTLAKAVSKAQMLTPRKAFEGNTDTQLLSSVKDRLLAAKRLGYGVLDGDPASFVQPEFRPCYPHNSSFLSMAMNKGGALLVGLAPSLFGWVVETFVPTCDFESDSHETRSVDALTQEYDSGGYNESFRSVIQGTVCVIGRASAAKETACAELGLDVTIGSTIGDLDCHVGGVRGSCGESAATIQHSPTSTSDFQFMANNNTDLVTLNGKRIVANMGSFPLFNEDICSVGARVFVFLLPSDSS